MMKRSNLGLFLCSIAVLGVSGCARYRAIPLKSLMLPQEYSTQQTEQHVSFVYRVFSTADCKRYLDRNPIAKGFQPIQIRFTNNTVHPVFLSPESFSLNCISVYDVAHRVHTNTVARVVGYSVPGLLLGLWPFFIPAIVDGVGSAKANERLDADFARKALSTQVVAPYSSTNGLIFVSRDEDLRSFTLTVTDQASGSRIVLRSNQFNN